MFFERVVGDTNFPVKKLTEKSLIILDSNDKCLYKHANARCLIPGSPWHITTPLAYGIYAPFFGEQTCLGFGGIGRKIIHRKVGKIIYDH